MARHYPTYALHVETRAKSKGTFLIRTVSPRFIAKIDLITPKKHLITVLEWWDECTIEQKADIYKSADSWLISNI